MYTSITLRASGYEIRHATCTVTCNTNFNTPTYSVPLKAVTVLTKLWHFCSLSISVITKGKYAVLEGSALDKLIPLLSDINSEVRLNAIKALTLLAEAPKAKVQLQSCLPKVSGRKTCYKHHH